MDDKFIFLILICKFHRKIKIKDVKFQVNNQNNILKIFFLIIKEWLFYPTQAKK